MGVAWGGLAGGRVGSPLPGRQVVKDGRACAPKPVGPASLPPLPSLPQPAMGTVQKIKLYYDSMMRLVGAELAAAELAASRA